MGGGGLRAPMARTAPLFMAFAPSPKVNVPDVRRRAPAWAVPPASGSAGYFFIIFIILKCSMSAAAAYPRAESALAMARA